VELTAYRIVAFALGCALSIVACYLLRVDIDRWQTWVGFVVFGFALALIDIGLGLS
jgi:hypothetical protein